MNKNEKLTKEREPDVNFIFISKIINCRLIFVCDERLGLYSYKVK